MSESKKLVRVNKYFEPVNRDFANNPFATVWPPDIAQQFKRLLSQPIAYLDEERMHPVDQRLQYVFRLMNFYQVLGYQAQYAASLFHLICAGYASRYVSRRDVTAEFESMCELARSGKGYSNHESVEIDSWTACLLGSPGCGKTSLLRRLMSRLAPGVLHHHQHGEVYQLLACHVVAPKGAHPKQLMQDTLSMLLAEAAAIDLPMPFAKTPVRQTETQLLSAIEALAKALNLGILIVDEVQHLLSGPAGRSGHALRSLTTLMAHLRIPVLLVGTWDALPGLSAEGRLARRSTGPGSGYFRRMVPGAIFNQFLTALWRLQYTSTPVALSVALAESMYHHTQGLHDLVVKLYAMVQVRSILSGENISVPLIDAVAKESFDAMQPMLRQLRRGKMESEVRIADCEPPDIDAYVRSYIENPDTVSGWSGPWPKRSRPGRSAPVKAAAAAAEADSDEKVVTGPLMRKTMSAKRQAETDAEFQALEDSDIRKVVYLASKSAISAEQALRNHGYIHDLAEAA